MADLRYRPWSWSPDGRRIVAYSERGAGMIVYDVDTGQHEQVTASGAKPRWLSDSRRVYTDAGALHLLDTRTKKSGELYRLKDGVIIDPAISRDDRTIYFIREWNEADVWLATLKYRWVTRCCSSTSTVPCAIPATLTMSASCARAFRRPDWTRRTLIGLLRLT
jgi:Tol biopolymer transport system component